MPRWWWHKKGAIDRIKTLPGESLSEAFLRMDREAERGLQTEQRVFQAFSRAAPREAPPWFQSILRPTRGQDRRGIDLFVLTRGGRKLPIQIKSSNGGRAVFYEKHPEAIGKIEVVIVRADDSEEAIRKKIYNAAIILHAKLAEQKVSQKSRRNHAMSSSEYWDEYYKRKTRRGKLIKQN